MGDITDTCKVTRHSQQAVSGLKAISDRSLTTDARDQFRPRQWGTCGEIYGPGTGILSKNTGFLV